MSIDSVRNTITRLQKEKTSLDSSLLQEKERARKKQSEINSIKLSIKPNTSASSVNSKRRQIESKEKQLHDIEKKIKDMEKKIILKNAEILKNISNIEKLEEQNQKKKDSEEKRRRDNALNHTKSMTRELERQSMLHRQLSSKQIIIDFAKLPEKIIVLFIASNPTNQTQLRLDEEIRAITEKIRASTYRDSVELRSLWATRPTDLLQAINEFKPTVVHFSGHGSEDDELILQDDFGNSKTVSKRAIVEMFKVISRGIRLVVFNTCFSQNQAEEVTNHIPSAIGMSTSIGDEAARIFAAQLYSAIGFGKDIGSAFSQAKVALMLEDVREEDTPQLFMQAGLMEDELILVKPS